MAGPGLVVDGLALRATADDGGSGGGGVQPTIAANQTTRTSSGPCGVGHAC